jgi:TolA-binding protein
LQNEEKPAQALGTMITSAVTFATEKVLRALFPLIALASVLSTAASLAQNPPPGADTPAMEVTKLFNTAMEAFQRGDYQAAATNLESVIAKAGEGAQLEPVYFTLGASYFNLEQYDKAIKTLKKYQQKYPQGARMADATFCIGQAAFMSKNYGEAVAAFSQVENIPPLREQALQYKAAAYKEDGKVDEAIQTLEKLITPEIKSTIGINGAMTLAGLYAEKKQPDKANALVRRIFQNLDLVDNMVRLNSMAVDLGDNLLNDQHPGEAIEAYRNVRTRDEVIQFQAERIAAVQKKIEANLAAMRANPSEASQYIAVHGRLKDELAKAKELYEEAQKLPDFAPIILLRQGKAWYEWDKKWEAIVAFNRLVKKYPQAKERESALFAMLTTYADVNQPERAQQLCQQYLKEYPKGQNADTVAYLLGATALQSNDPKDAENYFGQMLEQRPDSSMKEDMRFLLANAKFAQGKFDEAIRDYKQYLQEYPDGHRVEEATYRIGAADVFSGKYEAALESLGDYVKKYPKGTFTADAKYRLMVCKYAAQQYDEVIADVANWRQEFPNDPMEGEVLALLGDVLAAQGKSAEAIPVYIESYKKATSDEVMNYSLFEASKHMQKLGKWNDVTQLFQEFVKEKPDSPSVVAAMFWIGKALAHEGKTDEAKQFLVEQLKRYIGDPQREAVEQLLQQLAQLCSKRPRPASSAASAAPVASAAPSPALAAATTGSGSPSAVVVTPTPLPPYDSVGELDRQLKPLEENANDTTKARLLYAKAELATLRRKPDEHDKFLSQIAEQFKPEDLSPLLLAQGGDFLLAKGDNERATAFYDHLKDYYPKSNYLDFAYVGLGEIAFAKKDYETALDLFTEAADKIAQSKLKEATVGKAKTLLEMGKYDESKKLFEQVATVREWRGESTAFAVYSMGDIEERQGHYAEAIAYYQRVFVLYQKYTQWVAKAYIKSAECFDKLGKRQEAINHLKEMLRNEKLQKLPDMDQARQMLEQWGAAA